MRRWHRRAGVAAAALLIFLLTTGVPLQFSGALGLGQRHVAWAPILDWYALEAPREVAASGGIVSVGDELFLASGESVAPLDGFRGAVSVQGLTAVAGNSEVLLLSATPPHVLDRFPMSPAIRRIGLHDGQVILDTADGLLRADAELVNWNAVTLPPVAIDWAVPSEPPDSERFRTQFRRRMLTVERLLQDAHSGRLLGTPGIVLVDAAAVLLTFLAISGLIIWWRASRR